MYFKVCLSLLIAAGSVSAGLSIVEDISNQAARLLRPRDQIVFPPANGPCLQNVGKTPRESQTKLLFLIL